MEGLQALPTKLDMAEMMSHLECMIKGELNATRLVIQNVLQGVEESKIHSDEHKKGDSGTAGKGRIGLAGNEKYPI